jgi:PAS domain S-box-containing protein
MARAGNDDGYLDDLQITWDDAERGQGPVGRAIRSGRPALARDIPTDPKFSPWREAAVSRGYGSAVSLPLKRPFSLSLSIGEKRETVWGSLNIYAEEVDAFDEEEVKLLDELAADLSYGITTLRTRQARNSAEKALRESEERLRLFVDNVGDYAFITLNPEGQVISWNTGAERLLGYKNEEIIGRHFLCFYPPEDVQRGKPQYEMQQAHLGGRFQDDGRRLRKDGTWFWANVVFTALQDHHGELLGYGNVIRDLTHQKEIEKIQRDSEIKYRIVADNTYDWEFWLDPEDHFLYSSPSCRRITGYPATAFLDDHTLAEKIIHPRDLPSYRRLRQEFLETLDPTELIFRIVRADGSLRWIEQVCQPVFGDQGRFIGTRGSNRDITLRKQNEEELSLYRAHLEQLVKERTADLETSEKRYRMLFNSGNDAIFVHEILEDGRPHTFVEVNDVACARLGYTREEFLSLSPKDLQSSEAALHLPLIRKQLREKGSLVFETLFRTKEGRPIPMEISAQLFEMAGRQMVFSIARDITERKKAEEELRKLWLAVEQSPVSVVITNPEGAIEYVNPTFVQVTGYSREEALGQNPRILKSGLQPPEFYQTLWETLSSGQAWSGDLSNKKKNGEIYWESASIAPIRNREGEVTHYVAVKADISERRRLEEDLQKAKSLADAANRAKSLFLSNMSHEIRTPLNAILGFSQLLLREPTVTPSQRQYLETINRSGENLLSLINEILDISKIEAGRMTLNPGRFNLRLLLADLEKLFRLRTEAKHLHFLCEYSDALPVQVLSDEGKVRQILTNLLDNAVKFTPEGGIALRVNTRREGDHYWRLILEVEDSGIGMTPEETAKLFKPFEQTGAGAKFGGTGLGLALSRELARLMGGDIRVNSTLGHGSIFHVEINIPKDGDTEQEAVTIKRQVIGLEPGQGPFRILIADDKPENRFLLQEMLRPLGFQVESAADGREAVEGYYRFNPHLILMDLRMPVLNGYEAVKHIRESISGRNIPIIGISASVFEEDRRKGLSGGLDAFLRKPFREQELFEALRQCLSLKYQYAEEQPTGSTEGGRIPEPDPEWRTMLSPGLLQDMHLATLNGDLDRLLEQIQEVEKTTPEAAQRLRTLANRYEYERLLNFFEGKGKN